MRFFLTLFLLSLAACSSAPQNTVVAEPAPTRCSACAKWNLRRDPIPIYGNTYYVGTNGLSAILVTSPEGHVLIDGALSESAPLIAANVEALGFRIEDVKLILNSHAHFDHAGGLAALQQASGAVVAASPSSASVLEAGLPGADDPQYAELLRFPITPVRGVRVLADGETVRVGPIALTAHFTPGHTAGGTTWTWTSCEGDRCLRVVYADSLTPVAEEGFRFHESERYPAILAEFEHSFALVESLSCDILLAPHPEAASLFERVAARGQGEEDALIDSSACARYASAARQQLAQRLEAER